MRHTYYVFFVGCMIFIFSTFGSLFQAQNKADTNPEKKKQEIDNIIKAYAAINKFNGTALIHYHNKTLFEKSYGWQNAEKKILNQNNSIYQIASLTKSFTALTIVKLSEEGKLSVKDPISKFIADYPRGNEITVENLLTHTSGIYEPLRNREYFRLLHSGESISRNKQISFFKDEPLDFEPGKQFSYTNSGYILLGVIIEKITGMPYEEAVRKMILNPLKMDHTGFDYPSLTSPEKTVPYAYLSKTKQEKTEIWNPELTGSAGQIYSTVEDLYKYYTGLRDYKIVSKEAFKKATTPFLSGYGYGWFIDDLYGKKVINHGGNIEGATSYLAMLPEDDICIVLLNNITSKKLEKAGNTILGALLDQPYDLPKPKKEATLDSSTLKKYVGNYHISEDDIIHITLKNGQLFFQNNSGPSVRILPEKENSFFVSDDDTEITFSTEDGKELIQVKNGLSSKTAEKY
ncbi:serine hydrolase [Chryseobacterium shigense]|uniref:CubicO group peptidase (Beta-lactamase class C family) n=1 Tax=Chryseobacterium shigense TaxID=297244 RepID=A0A841NBC8_9FLAO|nr:serine hydrolase [Chryseobacterium shigense]MBB6369312.1 CubicO group peptidase (beta-lactamase class C family) [Chryseobacterium shigense]